VPNREESTLEIFRQHISVISPFYYCAETVFIKMFPFARFFRPHGWLFPLQNLEFLQV